MFKKVVPLSALIATAMGAATTSANPSFVPGTWVAGTVPTTGPGASNCCYINAGSTVTINDDATPSLTATGGITGAPTPCQSAAFSATTATGGNLVLPLILSTTAGSTATVANANDGSGNAVPSTTAKGATLTVSNGGASLSYVPVNSAAAATPCTAQTFTRSTQAKISDIDGKWSVGAGSGTGASSTCCFLDTTNGVTVATTGAVTIVTGKYAASAQCTPNPASNGGVYTRDLVATATSGQATDYLTNSNDLFTYNSATKTITYVPQGKGAAVCTQTLTYVPESGAGILSAMTPVVVGAAVLGLAAI